MSTFQTERPGRQDSWAGPDQRPHHTNAGYESHADYGRSNPVQGSPDVGLDEAASTGKQRLTWSQRLRNNWPVVPLRVFLGALFLFASYAKFSYPGFFNVNSPSGLKTLIDGVRPDSPIKSALRPVSEHAALFGHISAYAEIAIGAGLILGVLTRIAALGGIVLTTLIVLSIHWNAVKQYTASSGWFTSVDIVVAVALTVFVIGGAGPLSGDRLVGYLRARRISRETIEPGIGDTDPDASFRRLQSDGHYSATAGYPTETLGTAAYGAPVYAAPASGAPVYAAPASRTPAYDTPIYGSAGPVTPPSEADRAPIKATQQLPEVPLNPARPADGSFEGPPRPDPAGRPESAVQEHPTSALPPEWLVDVDDDLDPTPRGRVDDAPQSAPNA